jgi:hypothetical protein
VAFPNSERKPLFDASTSANADMFIPKAETGPAITIAGRHKQKFFAASTPGAIYDVHVSFAILFACCFLIYCFQSEKS